MFGASQKPMIFNNTKVRISSSSGPQQSSHSRLFILIEQIFKSTENDIG